MKRSLNKLRTILSVRFYFWIFISISLVYLFIYLVSLGDITFSGGSFGVASVEWSKMLKRSGYLTFEPIYQLSTPVLTVLLSPINLVIGTAISTLVGVNLTVTVLAFGQPSVCDFNRSVGVISSLPALLAGGACCAPVIVLIFGLQMSTLVVSISQFMIPIAIVLLVITLVLILRKTRQDAISEA